MDKMEAVKYFIERASQLHIDIRYPFGEAIDGNYEEITSAVDELEKEVYSIFDEPVELRYGASKVVIMSEEWDYVLKIPFNGAYTFLEDDYNEYCDNHDSEPQIKDYITFEKYRGADSEDGWDYCDAENNKYDKAEKAEVNQYFVKTEFLCFTNGGYPIYIQDRCRYRTSEDKSTDKSRKIASSRQAEYKDGGINSVLWIASFIDFYGEAEFEKLRVFLDSDEDLNGDLHDENVGYTMEGKPIILDYAGFNS